MQKESFKYSRAEILESFQTLTPFELELIPEEVKMAYLDDQYGYWINEARKKESKEKEFRGYVDPKYSSYFEANGCTVENFDVGVETAVVKVVNKNKVYEVKSEDLEKLEYYRYILAEAKALAFESFYERLYTSVITGMKSGETIDFSSVEKYDPNQVLIDILYGDISSSNSELTLEEKRSIMEAELSLLVEDMEQGLKPKILNSLSEDYKDVLYDMLYDLEEYEAVKKLEKTNPEK